MGSDVACLVVLPTRYNPIIRKVVGKSISEVV